MAPAGLAKYSLDLSSFKLGGVPVSICPVLFARASSAANILRLEPWVSGVYIFQALVDQSLVLVAMIDRSDKGPPISLS